MDRRFLLFIVLSTLLLWVNIEIIKWLNPPPLPVVQEEQRLPLEAPPPSVGEFNPAKEQVAATVEEDKRFDREWIALGSADSSSPYRMLVVLTNRGAAVEWAGLNDPKYLDLDSLFEKRGYLGYLALTRAPTGGAKVNVVGAGTPAEGYLQPGDVITAITSKRDKEITGIEGPHDLDRYLMEQSRYGEEVQLEVARQDKDKVKLQTIAVTLGKKPLAVLTPEPEHSWHPALSFMLTLAELGDRKLEKDAGITFKKGGDGDGAVIAAAEGPAKKAGLLPGDKITRVDKKPIGKPADFKDALDDMTVPTGAYLEVEYQRGDGKRSATADLALPAELPGVRLTDVDWQIVPGHSQSTVEFRRRLPNLDIELIKRYTLAKTAEASTDGDQAAADPATADAPYHLRLDVEIKKTGGGPVKLAYQLDGPQGLPTEGWWYASKISRTWDSAGARDLVYSHGTDPVMINAPNLGQGAKLSPPQPADGQFDFMAVDARYFAAAVIPVAGEDGLKPKIQIMQPLIVGPLGPASQEQPPLTNSSFRLITQTVDLAGDNPLRHSYTLFLGPKQPEVLAQPSYDLTELIYYGWSFSDFRPPFADVARLMSGILHFFYWLIPNYGVAIILLTVVVRLCMFPLSRKQALGAQKMQKLQPELKRLVEKHKNDYEGRAKAQRELFRKHNYNPAGGCLLVFIQLPIFVGLYKALSVDTELRQAPLIRDFYWCSDLSAPDRLFHWGNFFPFLTGDTGWLGPYFNLLPIITIVLFLVQQKMFMPPPTDEQQALQQKMMTYMMIFFGFLFFKVPSGLCIYFIASSLWGIAERKLLPKMVHETDEKPAPVAEPRRAVPERAKSRGEPQATPKPAGGLANTALGKMFKSLTEAADNQPRTQPGKRRQKKRNKGGK
jgi:YidC/Oxa1 family membrane protein insertase